VQQQTKFSKACEYGIRATICIAAHSLAGRKVSLKDVAATIESPVAYTSKILQKLSRSKIIRSEKGPSGGFSIGAKELDQLKLSAIVFTIDGSQVYNGCGLGLKGCNEKMPCPVHDQFVRIRDKLKKMLETTTVKSLALNHEKGLTFLKR